MHTVITVIFHSQQRQKITLYNPRRTATRNAILNSFLSSWKIFTGLHLITQEKQNGGIVPRLAHNRLRHSLRIIGACAMAIS
jgi:hypothetical protein